MKRLIIIIVIILVSVVTSWFLYHKFKRTTQTHVDLETNRKVVAEYDSDGNLDGISLAYHDKKLVASAEFKHGVKEGISIKYLPNGNKESVSYYVRDKEYGPRTVYYPTGKVKSVENWKEGRLYGNINIYYENGKLKCYQARDIKETIFYNYQLNQTGTLTSNHGQVFSKNLFSRLGDSIVVLERGRKYRNIKDLYITTSSPPGAKAMIEVLINQEKSAVAKIDSNTYRVQHAFKGNDNHVVTIVGKFTGAKNKIVKIDSLLTTIVVE